MAIEFDPAKDQQNQDRHGLSLAEFDGFDEQPIVLEDDRGDYGENRFRAFGRIDGVGHSIAYTVRDGNLRLISFRRAHEKEIARYE